MSRLGTRGHRRGRRAGTDSAGYISVFFAPTDTSREAGQQAAGRIFGARTTDRDEPTTWQTRQAQYDAVCAWGIPNHSQVMRCRYWAPTTPSAPPLHASD